MFFYLAKACQLRGWESVGRRILRPYFDSLESVGGSVSRVGLRVSGGLSVRHAESHRAVRPRSQILARPSQFIPGLMLAGAAFEFRRRFEIAPPLPSPSTVGTRTFTSTTTTASSERRTSRTVPISTHVWAMISGLCLTWSRQFEATHCPAMASNETIRAGEARGLCVLAAYLLPGPNALLFGVRLLRDLTAPFRIAAPGRGSRCERRILARLLYPRLPMPDPWPR